jgi:hypothetical protein
MPMTHTRLILTFAAVFVPAGASAQDRPTPTLRAATADSASAHQFVQKLYDWYLAKPNQLHGAPQAWITLNSSESLEPGLAAMLRADSAAAVADQQARQTLNFDPFLWSQDPCPRYEVTGVVKSEAGFGVTLRPVCFPENPWQTKRPRVEVAPQKDGGWRVANVFYGDSNNLRSLLCEYANADLRPERRPGKCRP